MHMSCPGDPTVVGVFFCLSLRETLFSSIFAKKSRYTLPFDRNGSLMNLFATLL
jgi:hypothetical protein